MDGMGQEERRHAGHQVALPHPLSSWPIPFILSDRKADMTRRPRADRSASRITHQ
jgi:hypothetical protein